MRWDPCVARASLFAAMLASAALEGGCSADEACCDPTVTGGAAGQAGAAGTAGSGGGGGASGGTNSDAAVDATQSDATSDANPPPSDGAADPPPGGYGRRSDLPLANSEMAVAEVSGKIYVLGGYP